MIKYHSILCILSVLLDLQNIFCNLLEIKDNYPKYVVSMDPVSGNLPEYPGVLHLNLRDFLVTNL